MPRKHLKILFSRQQKKTGLNGYVDDFSADYNAIAVDDILDIHKYLMKNNDIVYNAWIYKANICFSNGAFQLQCIKCKSIKMSFSE